MIDLSNKMKSLIFSMACGLMVSSPVAMSATNDVLSVAYQPVADVSQDQAQIVWFHPDAAMEKQGNANIYVDGEFQTSLIPGSYTAFCVKPGSHRLSAWLDDAPLYKGKQDMRNTLNVEGGKTYYIQADKDSTTVSSMLSKGEATPLLQRTRMQDILLSRASSVTACHYTFKDYNLASDIMFGFGKSSERDITTDGREGVSKIAQDISKQGAKIVVIGHTDPIGSVKANQALGLKRAETVRDLLVENGISASSISVSTAGSSEPVATGCQDLRSKQDKIACYSPDRRVVVRSYLK
ncbi:OmpA family protein [Scandinavium sp. M-37]|jgi:OOP family OmpA-OmpF porin|uniref:OmpA family protein n=1 Tax=Scandinavium sp. M-37 TaxID=3373077 RepID=UPI00374575AE